MIGYEKEFEEEILKEINKAYEAYGNSAYTQGRWSDGARWAFDWFISKLQKKDKTIGEQAKVIKGLQEGDKMYEHYQGEVK